ncbi:MAG TPA: response regulator [Kiloniellales bacterium]|jgi:two-component system chemotaxis response regulator CheY
MAVDLNMNVLIVDDIEAMLRVLRNLLKQLNFRNIDQAANGSEALAKLRAGDFGLVISDWQMEPMTGIDLVREMRADKKLKHLPFVMVTAETQKDRLAVAKQAGVDTTIIKPLTTDSLRKTLVGVLGNF